MSSMSFCCGHYFVTSVAAVDKGIGEVLALNMVEDVVAAFVLEKFPLFST